MLKAVEKLVASMRDTKQGNHRVEFKGHDKCFIYHQTTICKAFSFAKEFWVDNGGYGTSSTTRAINDYRRYFLGLGYTEIKKGEN